MGDFFEARDLWAAAGTPYAEHDNIEMHGPLTRTVIFAAFWRGQVQVTARAAARAACAAAFDMTSNATCDATVAS